MALPLALAHIQAQGDTGQEQVEGSKGGPKRHEWTRVANDKGAV
jgi:hypothetical protein